MNHITIAEISESAIQLIYSLIHQKDSEDLYRTIGFLPSIKDIKRHTFADPDFEPSLLLGAFNGSELQGCIMGIRRPWKSGREETGFIKWLILDEFCISEAIGGALLDRCESLLRDAGCTAVEYGSCAPAYLTPGVLQSDTKLQDLLVARDWICSSERISLWINIQAVCTNWKLSADKLVEVPGFRVEIADDAAKGDVMAFVENKFSVSWAKETSPVFDDLSPGFCAIFREDGGGIAGFVAVNAGNPSWLGPMGIDQAFRGRGLGKLLARHAIEHAAVVGIPRLFFSWVNDSEGFYRRAIGAMERVVFYKFRKEF